MSGIKYVLDTNALISFFQGNKGLSHLITNTSLAISVISVIEFLSFKAINQSDKNLMFAFIKKIQVVDLEKDDIDLINIIADIRINFRVKLPDAIIAGTAIHNNAALITSDKDFLKIIHLQILTF